MVERNPNQRERFRGKVEAIAVRFSEENEPGGWQALINDLGLSLHVTETDGKGVYIFSSTHWSEVESALKEANMPYEYQRGSTLSRKNLNIPEIWNKIEHAKPQEGGVTNG